MIDAIDEDIIAGLLPTHAISLIQPWAYFMLSLPPEYLKPVENRNWGNTRRGPVWVHASKTMRKRDYEDACNFAISVGVPLNLLPLMESLQLGGIVGRFTIKDLILPGGMKRGPLLVPHPHPRRGDRWYMGAFGYVVDDARTAPFVQCKGALGFWRVPHDVLRRLAGAAQ